LTVKILACDTALGACSVAVLDGEKILAHRFVAMARGHAEALAPMVRATMAASGLGFAGLDRLAVTVGPGTFTGQRVGLAFMRGLRLALEKPLIGVTTLETMAAQAMAQSGLGLAAALHDARRGEIYLQILRGRESLAGPMIVPFAEAGTRLEAFATREKIALAGTGAPTLGDGPNLVLSPIRQPDALWVARLAMTADTVPEGPPAPLYLRAPDAKMPAPKLLRPDRDDPASLAALHGACFPEAWTAPAIAQLLATPGTFAFAGAQGFILVRAAADEAEILTIAVAPEARRRGLGRALLDAAAAHAVSLGAQRLFLEVSTANDAALALYRGAGFAQAGLRKGYYNGQDALILSRTLPPATLCAKA
jgi:tRNA threonylcarbamoyladenosine biosynthesis protein TsaB